jgi:NADPH:quinone reductase-like Zn-dependent oxidoreductase
MKEAIIHQGLTVKVVDESPIPVPAAHEIIIKTVVAATNPIDWKSTTREEEIELHGDVKIKGYNSKGKDMVGFVHSVGKCAFFVFLAWKRVGR